MTDSRAIVSKLNAKALGGAKIPHGISNPVLRMTADSLYIAVFVYTYKRENLQQNKMPRPIHWMIADIITGDPVNEFDCRQNDFSNAEFGELYDLNDLSVKKPSREDIAEIYSLLDSVRTEFINTGKLNAENYRRYLDRILEITPTAYRKFYQELSNA